MCNQKYSFLKNRLLCELHGVYGRRANCTPAPKTEGRYTYDADSKIIGIKLGDEGSVNYRIDILTAKDLKLAQQSGIFDMDGDKIPDIPYVTYKDKI